MLNSGLPRTNSGGREDLSITASILFYFSQSQQILRTSLGMVSTLTRQQVQQNVSVTFLDFVIVYTGVTGIKLLSGLVSLP